MILCLAILVDLQLLTGRQTDRQTDTGCIYHVTVHTLLLLQLFFWSILAKLSATNNSILFAMSPFDRARVISYSTLTETMYL